MLLHYSARAVSRGGSEHDRTQDGAFEPELSMSSRTSQVKRGTDSWLSWSNLGMAALFILTISLAISILMEGQS
jgi:hypothetical protein